MQLPIRSDLEDPLQRLKEVCRASKSVKANSEAVGLSDMGELSKQIPAPLLSLATNLLYDTGLVARLGQLFNLVVTNVPGPRKPLYFCGARMTAMYGLAPLAHTIGLVFSQVSYNGRLYFAMTADRDSIPDPEQLISCVKAAFGEYLALVEASSPPRGRTKARAGRRKSTKRLEQA
jgi:hypothetical protein